MNDTTYEYIDNALFIRDKYTACAVEWGKRPVAREQLGAGEWKEGRPHQRILVPPHIDAADSRSALDRFARNVPGKIFAIISPFRDYQWMPLRLLLSNPSALELAESNPVLCYALANNDHFRHANSLSVAWEQANIYSRRKQKLILQFLGFPSEKIIVKLMKKIDTSELSIGLVRLLRAALRENNSTIKLLSHYDNITAGMLGLANTTLSKFVTPELLADVAANENERFMSHTAAKLAELQVMMKETAEQFNPRPFLSIKAVNAAHRQQILEYQVLIERARLREEELLAEYRARREGRRLAEAEIRRRKHHISRFSFGKPPIAGTETIVPILTNAELKVESEVMRNCVNTYTRRIKSGRCYIYRVLEPERATLSIYIGKNGKWKCSELKSKCNRKVATATRKMINEWLREGNSNSNGLTPS